MGRSERIEVEARAKIPLPVDRLRPQQGHRAHLFTNPFWIRLPPTDCWPTHAIIWLMFRGEPLEPHSAMMRGLHGTSGSERRSSRPRPNQDHGALDARLTPSASTPVAAADNMS